MKYSDFRASITLGSFLGQIPSKDQSERIFVLLCVHVNPLLIPATAKYKHNLSFVTHTEESRMTVCKHVYYGYHKVVVQLQRKLQEMRCTL